MEEPKQDPSSLAGGNETTPAGGESESSSSLPESSTTSSSPAPAGSALDPRRTERFIPFVGTAVKFTDAGGQLRDALVTRVIDEPHSTSDAGDVAVDVALVDASGMVTIAPHIRHRNYFLLQGIDTTGNYYEYSG